MKRKILLFTFAVMCMFSVTANGEVLGTQIGGWSTYMGAFTYFHNVQFNSDSVGKQNEYYVEYTPNEDAVPIVVNGEKLWGTMNIKQAEQYMQENGLRPLAGINADYFSFKTGLAMGYTIIDGEIVSKEYGGQDAVGFRSDGTGFIKWLDIASSVSDGETKVEIMYINKWCQAGFDPIYLLTDSFGDTTKTQSECIFVICSSEEGRLHIDEEMTVTVDDVFIYDGEIEIPDGKYVLLMDVNGDEKCYDFLSRLAKGQKLTIANQALGDDGTWAIAAHALSSVGGRLVSNGVAGTNFEAGAAPRTAVGVKENGNIIFYTLDGRQSGYSYGAQLKTLAKRMLELGCVDAINLDGGGSTVISALFPGKDNTMVVNSPSDGYLRSVANYIFLKDNRERTDVAWIINTNESENRNYLSGMTMNIEIESVYDTSNYKMEEPYGIKFRAETDTDTEVDESGNVNFSGTGNVKIVMYTNDGDVTDTTYSVYENPEEIKIYNQADWKEINEINTTADEELQLFLSAASYKNNTELLSTNRLYKWGVEGDVGTITQDGIFTLAKAENVDGKIIVTVGDAVKEIPVHIASYPAVSTFDDTNEHWARDIIEEMSAVGVINGFIDDGKRLFKPDNYMTRAEFAVMIARYTEIDLSDYNNEVDFSDSDQIPEWAFDAIRGVNAENIILGRVNDDGTVEFAPCDNITRAEAMTVMGRIVNSDDDLPTLPFADKNDIPNWAVEGIERLYSIGIVKGYEDNTILPNDKIKRAEALSMLYNLTQMSPTFKTVGSTSN